MGKNPVDERLWAAKREVQSGCLKLISWGVIFSIIGVLLYMITMGGGETKPRSVAYAEAESHGQFKSLPTWIGHNGYRTPVHVDIDDFGSGDTFDELAARGQVFWVEGEVEVRPQEHYCQIIYGFERYITKITILEGRHQGRVGYVSFNWIRLPPPPPDWPDY